MTNILRLFGDEPRLADNLVFAHVRWSKALGLPEGRLQDAFDLVCGSYQHVPEGSPDDPRAYDLFIPHQTAAFEGAHDDAFYRLNIMTTSKDGVMFDLGNPLAHRNILTVSFRRGVKWPAPRLFRAWDVKVISPPTTYFQASKQWQMLPDIEVLAEPIPAPHLGP